MERDWNIIREILLRLEAKAPEQHALRVADFAADRAATIAYHVEILEEGGLVEAHILKAFSTPDDFILMRMTWSGHELLDAIRSDTVWKKTKQTIASKGLSMTLDLVKSVAVNIATRMILPPS